MNIFLLVCLNICVFIPSSTCHDSDVEAEIHPYLQVIETDPENVEELDNEFWKINAHGHIEEKLKTILNNNKAKNIIMFLGDGMSQHTLAATRNFIKGEEHQLSFEKFPYFGLSKTYCVDKQVADSACTATAYLSGVKANYGTIGVTADVPRHKCGKASQKSTHTESIAKWAQEACKVTGFVTTTRVTHASPAGLYAHTANRDWESNTDVEEDKCNSNVDIDIAQQLVHSKEGKNFKVILGGGRGEFLDKKMIDEEKKVGYRTDGKNLIKEWLTDRKSKGKATYVWNRNGLLNVDIKKIDYLLGLFNPGHCDFHGDIKRHGLENTKPTLTEMTETAIQILQKHDKGFFLFVEGGRIDMGHHETRARKALEDTAEFDRAIQKALDLTSDNDDTLIVVTSDHSHTMTINGYPSRGNDILGLSGSKGLDNLPYTTLSYANGPGYYNTYKEDGGGRQDLSKVDFTDAEYQYMATVPLESETHGGDDVGVYANGPHAHLFVGNYEQNNIPVLMAYASKIGPYFPEGDQKCGASSIGFKIVLIILSTISYLVL